MPGQGSVFRIRDPKTGRVRWVAQVSIGPRENRKYRKRVRDTEREAKAALAELTGQQQAGVSSSRITTGAFLEQWVADVRNIRPTTRHGYETAIRYHLAPAVGEIPLAALTPLHVEHLLAGLTQRLSAKTARNVHAVLRRALNFAVRQRLVASNVAGREFVDAPRVEASEPRALAAAEVRRLLAAARGDRLEALIVTAVGTGLRQGELLGLAWEDVDLDHARLHVRRELVRRDGHYVRDQLKTERSKRSVPLSPAVVEALRAHRQRVIEAGFTPISTGPVFTTPAGKPLNGSWVTHRFYALCEVAGIPRLPFKNLRTTFSTRLFEAGVPDLRIRELMGHTRESTTRRHYIARSDEWAPAIAAVEELVG